MNIGLCIKKRREAYDLTQAELARRSELSRSTIAGIEAGIKIPSLLQVIRIADCLNCSIDEIVGRRVS